MDPQLLDLQPERKKQLLRDRDGTLYKGELLNGRKSGQGVAVYPDGRVYKGMWKDDVPCGRGLYRTHFGLVATADFDAGLSIVSKEAKFCVGALTSWAV